MNFPKNLVNERINKYATNQIKIISSDIDIKRKDPIYLRNLATISLFCDSLFKEKKSFFKKDTFIEMKDDVKELIVESLISQFEFINKETGLSLNDYLNRYANQTKKIFLSNDDKIYEEFGENSSGQKQIALSNRRIEEAKDLGFLYRCFSHESNHAFCNEFSKGHNIKRFNSYQQIHEFLTELYQVKMTSINHSDFLLDISLERPLDNDFKYKFHTNSHSYEEITAIGKIINNFYEDEFKNSYFGEGRKNVLFNVINSSSKTYKLFEELNSSYYDYFSLMKHDKDASYEALKNMEKYTSEIIFEKVKDSSISKKDLWTKINIEERKLITSSEEIDLNQRLYDTICIKLDKYKLKTASTSIEEDNPLMPKFIKNTMKTIKKNIEIKKEIKEIKEKEYQLEL